MDRDNKLYKWIAICGITYRPLITYREKNEEELK